ncbi:MAG TPA: tRNA (guanosine(37)-N1)-methyltransferase TrmD [Oceanospirillaceae bacterium]|nr:tRNA (guanosine(37)-N1)-methyltransferase TrmD [Oceanospirillaceae bacterium]
MKVSVVTLFPEMLQSITDFGVTGRAVQQGLLQVTGINPRDFTHDKHRTVDDRPYGGGPGMLMKVQPLRDAITAAKADLPNPKVIYLSPQGRKLDQSGVLALAELESLVLVAGRYEGIDERLMATDIDEEWSLGDFVLSGGELPAMVLIDAVARMLPGVLGHTESAQEDSFAQGLLDCPHYTRPEVVDGIEVPEVLLSGDHQAIAKWRMQQQLGRTWQRRPDLLDQTTLTAEQQQSLADFIRTTATSAVEE